MADQLRYRTLLILLFFPLFLLSQSIERYAFVNAARVSSNNTITLESSIGEIMVNTFNGTQIVLSQGFIQPDPLLLPTVINVSEKFKPNIFPNPVSDNLYIGFNEEFQSGIVVELYDLLGKKQFITSTMGSSNGLTYYILNMEEIVSGIYFVSISSKDGSNKIFKISKI